MKCLLVTALFITSVAQANVSHIVGKYEGLGPRAQRCEVLITENQSGLDIRMIGPTGNTQVTFSQSPQSLSENAQVVSNGKNRAVFGFGDEGELQIVLFSGSQNLECGSLRTL